MPFDSEPKEPRDSESSGESKWWVSFFERRLLRLIEIEIRSRGRLNSEGLDLINFAKSSTVVDLIKLNVKFRRIEKLQTQQAEKILTKIEQAKKLDKAEDTA